MEERKVDNSGFKIRNLSSSVLIQLTEIAKKKGISREELCRRILTSYVLSPSIFETEERYAGLIESYTESIRNISDKLEELTYAVERRNK